MGTDDFVRGVISVGYGLLGFFVAGFQELTEAMRPSGFVEAVSGSGEVFSPCDDLVACEVEAC
ncbi:hypothetical protein [Saccharopolyspora phatthalungensis]|uniref:Uncharacterized protein n=1 Tax=Saccharopolyspora phatthalungensis TaxID=664693 RepID=A0A840Q1E1_9PSEU|nr:hypothetical protein [Saccharopolyspora phatthalungensis]MBB5154194.1 hypothetical protein [Saccharopolyspora phatthalungensis]